MFLVFFNICSFCLKLTRGKREIYDFRVCSVNPYDVMDTNWLLSSIVVAVAFDYAHLFLVFEKEGKLTLACE